jgi:hypothetical protein
MENINKKILLVETLILVQYKDYLMLMTLMSLLPKKWYGRI